MTDTSRRSFIRTVAAGTLAVGGLSHAADRPDGDDDGHDDHQRTAHRPAFLHGVASGDPLQDRVMLWTRVTPPAQASGEDGSHDDDREPRRLALHWQVARDAEFRSIVAHGQVRTSALTDHTAKVDAGGLRAGTTYWFRFRCKGVWSPVGRTRTLPRGGVSQVRLAVFSCSNYPAGHFNAYGAAAQLAHVDAAVHLGDYIYEYGRGQYASQQAAALGREVLPAGELLTLADYRARYAQYRTDADLQALHAAMPLIAVWDDHEIANDTWSDGAENHDPATEGDWQQRRAAAIQAYHEWMPTRLPDPQRPDRIYRSFDFGDLLSLHMLDTRVIGRDRQMAVSDYVGATGFDAARYAADLAAPGRQLLGIEQQQWLIGQMARSTARWQVLGQQVLMARMNVPAPLLLGQISVSGYAALAARAASAPQTLSAAELAILRAPSIPYNLDAWDGYAVAREQLLGAAFGLDKNLVVLAGDTHNAWASDLTDFGGRPVGVEFATPSVSSPGFETIFPNENPQFFAAALQQLIGPLVYADTSRRGYLVIDATPEAVQAQWHFVETIARHDLTVQVGPTLRTRAGVDGRRIEPTA
ncbi:alkaline phosphatase D family protein [Leptothrix discophora]|uniref:Alkaline phosphatase D family protein n=1 Tax=Leptothrix discophora TaxID=89 RepID=A0ABT9G8Q1_LEPDI|nr:alkaline phosphatase D family protein [Leptothrix discophora]MDP4302845.1 alkaline phosphatase D family protein [Leptothrix discophora]